MRRRRLWPKGFETSHSFLTMYVAFPIRRKFCVFCDKITYRNAGGQLFQPAFDDRAFDRRMLHGEDKLSERPVVFA